MVLSFVLFMLSERNVYIVIMRYIIVVSAVVVVYNTATEGADDVPTPRLCGSGVSRLAITHT